jgi:hypothetical protein
MRADERIESIRDQCVDALDEKIEVMNRIAFAGAAPGQTYVLASEIFSLAATFDLVELSQAASSLCDVLDQAQAAPDMAQSGPAFGDAVNVHVAALRTLRGSDLSTEARVIVVNGLRRIAAKFKIDD